MTASLRVIDTSLNSARWNIAVTAALSELHLGGGLEDTLRLHRYEKSVLLGQHQKLDQAVDRGFCRQQGIGIARRITGGGAVYMSPGVLAWDLVLARRTAASLEEVSARIGGAIANALAGFGIAAYFLPPGDVVVGDRKISGSAGWHDGGSLIHQGTVLIDADLEEMASALRIPSDGTPLPVMTLADEAAALPRIDDVADAVMASIAQALGRQARFDRLSSQEADLASELLAEEIGTEDFIEGEAASHPSAATTSLQA